MENMGSELFQAINKVNQAYFDNIKRQSTPIDKEKVYCFECGESFLLETVQQKRIYESAGMCEKCEQKALGESDPVQEMLSSIIGRLDRIEKLLKKEV